MSNQLNNKHTTEAWNNLSDAAALKYNSNNIICKNLIPIAHHNLDYAQKNLNTHKPMANTIVNIRNKSLTQAISLCKKK
jgi:hypothetical protein